MEILIVSAELSPFASATPAAQVVEALSRSLVQLEHQVTLAMPRFPGFEEEGLLLARRLTPLELADGSQVTVFDGQLSSGVKIALFDSDAQLFDREGVYGEVKDYPDNAQRFGLFGQAVAALVKSRREQGQAFEVVHGHDWPGALALLHLQGIDAPPPSLLTIHNGGNQGSFATKELAALGFQKGEGSSLKLGSRLNVLKAGIEASKQISTVSPSYAVALQDSEVTGALAEIVTSKRDTLEGILSGLDYGVFNPATDSSITVRYDAAFPDEKESCKHAFLRKHELDLDLQGPLIAISGDLEKTAGFAELVSALPDLVKARANVVVAGKGAAGIVKALGAAKFQKLKNYTFIQKNDTRTERSILAAADIMLCPDPHDKNGIIVRKAQRYGAVPVAFAGGAVRDLIVDCDAQLASGTGFLFETPNVEGRMGAGGRALSAFQADEWERLVKRVMRIDSNWDRPARRYAQLYRGLVFAISAA